MSEEPGPLFHQFNSAGSLGKGFVVGFVAGFFAMLGGGFVTLLIAESEALLRAFWPVYVLELAAILSPFIVIVPFRSYYTSQNETETVQGILLAAGLLMLLSGGCWGALLWDLR